MNRPSRESERVDPVELRALLSDLSGLLLKWSWEGVTGYEEMVEKVGRVYGFEDTKVFMEAQCAMIQVEGRTSFVKIGIPGFPPLTHTQALKNLLADIYDEKLSIEEARAKLRELEQRKPPYSIPLVCLGVIVVSMAFAVDIVGTWEGVFYGGLTAIATGACFILADRFSGFGKVAQLAATFLSGVIVMLACKHGLTVAAPGLLLIASTFVFLPGDSISTQAYELAQGRWSAGVDRFVYAFIQLALMVTGAILALAVTGTPVAELFPAAVKDTFPWWSVYPGRIALVLGTMFAFQMDKRHFLPALLVLLPVTAVAQVVTMAWGEIVGTLAASIFGIMISTLMARGPRSVPIFVLMIPVVFALSPGSHGLREFETLFTGQQVTGVNDLRMLVGILLAIGLGMLVGRSLTGHRHWINNWPKQPRRG